MAREELSVVFGARHFVVIAFQFLSYFGRPTGLPWWEPIVDFAVVVPYCVVAHWLALRRGHVPQWVPVVDSLILVLWLAAQPASSGPLIAMMVATLTICGQSVPRRSLMTAFLVSIVGVTFASVTAQQLTVTLDSIRYIALGGGVLATVTYVRSARLEARRLLAYTAAHDQLTGLANRTLLHTRLDEMSGSELAVLLGDLDNFKDVNDALGHHVGDKLLVEVGRRIVGASAADATVCRLGGDEFAVVLPNCGRQRAVEAADRLTAALREPFVVDGLTVEVGASLGIALCAGGSATPADELLRDADVAMYQAKAAGRPFRVYDPVDDHTSVRRVTLLGELRTAITEGQLEVWYQPALDMATGELDSMEALVRWRHPRHGLLMPGEFIELAEVSGAIDDLTKWVIEQSVRDTLRLVERGRAMQVSCNLSVRNLHDRELLEWILAFVRDVGFPPQLLYLELTESQIMEDPAGASAVLRRLAEAGIRSMVDDFGTGYSSMSTLLHVQAAVLKIDRSFVADLLVTREADVMVRSMVDLAHNLGMQVVAEGVEDQPTLDRLAEFGCDVAQGFHIARPMPFEQLVSLLEFGGVEASP